MRVIDTFRTVLSLAYSPCGRFVYSAGWQHVSRWDVASGAEQSIRQKACAGYCRSVVVSPEGQQLAWLAQPSADTTWEVRVGKSKPTGQTSTQPLPAHIPNLGPMSIGFLRDGRVVTHAGELVVSPDGVRVAFREMKSIPDGTRVTLQEMREAVYLVVARVQPAKFTFRSSAGVQSLKLVERNVILGARAFGFAGQLFWWVDEFAVTVRDLLASGDVRFPTTPMTPRVVTPDGRTGIATSQREVLLLDLPSGAIRQRYNWDVGTVAAVAVAPDGLTAAAAGWSGGIAIFDLDS